jgi:hypothetical protein
MPIKVRKVRGQECYRVFNGESGEVYAKCTTRAKALEQKKIIEDADKMKKDLNMTDKEINEEVVKVIKETKGKVVVEDTKRPTNETPKKKNSKSKKK